MKSRRVSNVSDLASQCRQLFYLLTAGFQSAMTSQNIDMRQQVAVCSEVHLMQRLPFAEAFCAL